MTKLESLAKQRQQLQTALGSVERALYAEVASAAKADGANIVRIARSAGLGRMTVYRILRRKEDENT